MDTETIITLVVTVAIAIISGVLSFVLMYYAHLTKVKEQIAKLEEKIMDKDAVQQRITVLEEGNKHQQKFFDFLNDQVMEQVFNKNQDK